jgi:multimeric flavodoxin WrbA
MNSDQVVLGLVGSPNKIGRTNELVSAALEGASRAGAATELVQMSDCVVEACKDCIPWICNTNQKCTYADKNFELLSKKILDCGALVIGTPVYWGDTTGMVRYLFLKMYRVYAGSGQLKGLPALGIAIAGGSGNGLTSGLKPLYHFYRAMQMRAIEPLPATRFDFDKAIKEARLSGHRLAQMMPLRAPFKSPEECWLSYGAMPYIGENRAIERRLLAAIAYEAVSKGRRHEVEGDLAQADILAAAGLSLDAMNEVTKVYNSCIKIIGAK